MLNEKVIWIQTFVNNIDQINVTSNKKIYSHEFYKVILNSILNYFHSFRLVELQCPVPVH